MAEVSENKQEQDYEGSGVIVAGDVGGNVALQAENVIMINGAEVNESRNWRFDFHGTANEYFKIWIVNLFLSVITLSFYSPWAKVRRLRYFYGNTVLGQDKFDFTAIPSRILIGRIIATVLFVAFSMVSNLDPVYAWVAPALMFAVMPWLVRSTMRFRARNTKYGNSRFYFSATMGQSYWLLVKCAAVTVLSLGLLYPLALYWFKSYQINHLHIGSLRFNLNSGVGGFYGAVLKPLLLILALIVVMGIILTGMGYASQEAILPLIYIALMVPYLFILGFLVPLTQGYLFRATWLNVNVGKSRITTDLNPYKYSWIKLTNYIAAIFTLGLLLPWGAVRLYRYQAQSLQVELQDNPQDLMNMAQNDPDAIGEEIADVFDIDISL
ncbi:MAG: YjgN family protein [Neisseria zoodegmatis]|uniref:YjgN family protein n=1 Tax=Neisseria zoodegmatis TaxID=326523 RepID=UPI0026EC35C3|nr:YjgN family protein [Neisseria zoodegmatis]MDO5069064.1 YjgN family protein [Neisseria zoodegmatis]